MLTVWTEYLFGSVYRVYLPCGWSKCKVFIFQCLLENPFLKFLEAIKVWMTDVRKSENTSGGGAVIDSMEQVTSRATTTLHSTPLN